MIMLSSLPKNSVGIIKLLNVNPILKSRLELLGFTIGVRVKVRKVINKQIIIESYISGNNEKIVINLIDALKIGIIPI